MTAKKRWCGDCSREDEYVNWCDVCGTFICIDCDALHDCTGDLDDELEDEEAQEPEDFSQLFPIPKPVDEDE